MLRIEPTTAQNYTFKSNEKKQESKSTMTDGEKTALTLAGLAASGVAAVALAKKSKIGFEEALKKNGVQIKDGIATLIETGEKYTGSIKRNVKSFGAKKETVQFLDGVMTEKVYHNAFGKELGGEFYKDNACLSIGSAVGSSTNKGFSTVLTIDKELVTMGDVRYDNVDSAFDWAREYMKSEDFLSICERYKKAKRD